MAYKAPHKKGTKLPSMDEFPTLGVPKQQNKVWKKSFSSLATEWNKQSIEDEEERKHQEEIREDIQRREALNNNYGFVGRFPTSYYDGPIYRDYDEDKPTKPFDEWTTVDRVKYRPELSIEEKNEKEIAKEEAEQQAKDELSVWKNEEWDVRDRRVIS